MIQETNRAGKFTLPGTSMTLNRMGYGAMQLAGPHMWGPPRDVDIAIAVLREAVKSGVNHIDTSDFYGPHVTNELIKQALHPYPDSLAIVTKVGARRGADKSWLPALTFPAVGGGPSREATPEYKSARNPDPWAAARTCQGHPKDMSVTTCRRLTGTPAPPGRRPQKGTTPAAAAVRRAADARGHTADKRGNSAGSMAADAALGHLHQGFAGFS